MKKLNHSKSDTLLITVDKKIGETLNSNLNNFQSDFLKKDFILPKPAVYNKKDLHNKLTKGKKLVYEC